MEIRIPTNKTLIYEQFLGFMNPFYKLTPNEVKVLAAILMIYKETVGAAEHVRWGYVFSTEGRERMKTTTEMNGNQLGLTFTQMYKKTIGGHTLLVKEPFKHVHPSMCIDPIEHPEITFKFIEQHEQEEYDEQPPAGDHSEHREEAQPVEEGEPEVMVVPVSPDPQEDSDLIAEGSNRELPPEFVPNGDAQSFWEAEAKRLEDLKQE